MTAGETRIKLMKHIITSLMVLLVIGAACAAQHSLHVPVTVGNAKNQSGTIDFGPALPLSALAFSRDGKTLYVGGYREVLVWDLSQARLAKRLGASQLLGQVTALVVVGHAEHIAVAHGVPGRSSQVTLIDARSGDAVANFKQPTDTVYALAVSPDGKHLLAGGADRAIRIWQLVDNTLVKTLTDHQNWVTDLRFSTDGKYLVSCDTQGVVKAWLTEGWVHEKTLKHNDAVQAAAFQPKTQNLVVAVGGASESSLRIRQLANPRANRAVNGAPGTPLDIQWQPNGSSVYVAGSDHTIRAFRNRGQPERTFKSHTDWVNALAISADGQKLASASLDGTVKLWQPRTGKLLATLVQIEPRTDRWVVFTPTGYYSASSPDAVAFRATKPAAVQALRKKLHQPAQVVKALNPAGTKPKPPTKKKG